MTSFLAAAVIAAAVPAGAMAPWPSFRGPHASGVAEGPAPLKWNGETGEGVLWKAEIPGLSVSSPIVWGGRVFVATAVSSDPNAVLRQAPFGDILPSKDLARHSWRVLAFDRKTGRVAWDRVAHEGIPRKGHPKSRATATPVTDGKTLVVSFGSEGLYAYDLEGRLLWTVDLLKAGWFDGPEQDWGYASSPVIHKDLVLLQCDNEKGSFVAAYRLRDGSLAWRTKRDETPSFATPTVYEGPAGAELVTHATKSIRGYDPGTGKELWRLRPNAEVATPTPIAARGLIFVAHCSQGIYAVKAGSRGDLTLPEGQDQSESIAWSKRRGGPYTPTPIVYGEYLYTCTSQGVLTCWKAKTGERVYQRRIGAGGSYISSPVAADGKLYFSEQDGPIRVVKAGPEYELLATNPMGEELMATPAISEGVLFVRGLQHLFAIAAR
jgi:outer membrane protein assembly factor BamB